MILFCSVCRDVCGGTCPKSLAVTSCGHLFHAECVREWWETLRHRGEHRQCPICKTEAFYDNLVEVFPTFQPDASVDSQLENITQQLRAEKTKSAQLREKMDDLAGRVRIFREAFQAKMDEAADWEHQAQFANESLAMYQGFYEQQKTRADELQQTCDQLRLTLITRTKVLFERSNRHSRPPRAHLADQSALDTAEEDEGYASRAAASGNWNDLNRSINRRVGSPHQPRRPGQLQRSETVRVNGHTFTSFTRS